MVEVHLWSKLWYRRVTN